MSMIRVMVSGRAATEPTIKDVNGYPCTSFGVIGDTGTKDEQGNWESIFFWVSVWGKKGESVAKNLKKGERVLVMGGYSQKLYVDKDGAHKIQNRINANDVDFLGGGKAQGAAAEATAPTAAGEEESEDTLPF